MKQTKSHRAITRQKRRLGIGIEEAKSRLIRVRAEKQFNAMGVMRAYQDQLRKLSFWKRLKYCWRLMCRIKN